MIAVQNLIKNYGENAVLKGLSLHVNKGEIYGFIGKNGAGKTTTLNILSGLSNFNSGECKINNVSLSTHNHSEQKLCGFLPEEPKFYNYMTGKEYLSFLGKILGLNKNEALLRGNELLETVGLADIKKKKIGAYSRGMKQRLGLAVAMYHKPSVLLLDEPSSALDPQGRQDMVKVLSILKEQGITIMLSTHILSDIETICDRVGVLANGKMALEGKLSDILREYANPGYELMMQKMLSQEDANVLKALPFVRAVQSEGKRVIIEAMDEEKNINSLYGALPSLQNIAISVAIRKANLDEVFRKVALSNE